MKWYALLGATKLARRKPVERGITVRTEYTEDHEVYEVVIDVNGNETARLSPPQVFAHANGMQAAASRAAYDEAIYRQAVESRGLSPRRAAGVVATMHRERPPLDPEATAPLRLGVVLDANHEGRVTVALHRSTIGRWSVIQADGYVRTLLAAQQRAENETAFHDLLVAFDGMSPSDALSTVTDTGTFHNF